MTDSKKIDESLYCPKCGNKGMNNWDTYAESGKRRYHCPLCNFRTTRPLKEKPSLLPKTKVDKILSKGKFIITSAVNDTDVVIDALRAFENIKGDLDASLVIIPTVYKNPDLFHMGVSSGYSWPVEIYKYICNTDISLNESIIVRGGDASRIPYTSVSPLNGLDNNGRIQSEIYGHQQVALKFVPTAYEFLPKMLHTTGTISKQNYGMSRQATKASRHHSISALFVEVEGDKFWVTQIHFDGTGAYLFDKYYTPDTIKKIDGVAGLMYGDIHVRFLDKDIHEKMRYLADVFNPRYQIFNDVHDHHIGSHHHKDDVLFHLWKNTDCEFSIRDELMLSVDFLKDKKNAVVIRSNHHEHLDQWFNRFNPKNDVVNLDLYFELGEMARGDFLGGGDGHLYRLFLQKYCSNELTFIDYNDYFSVAGIDCSQHGHRGGRGARGSLKSFARTGHKVMCGHDHAGGIEKGCYQVGAMSTPPYVKGYDSTMKTNGIIYDNGKCCLHSIVKGELSPIMRRLK